MERCYLIIDFDANSMNRLEVINVAVRTQPKSNRAKIFLSFDALSGLRQALAAKEREHFVARCLAEGSCREDGYPLRCEEQDYDLDYLLGNRKPGDTITLVCSQYGEQRRVRGRLKKIDYAWRQIVLDCDIVNADAIIGFE